MTEPPRQATGGARDALIASVWRFAIVTWRRAAVLGLQQTAASLAFLSLLAIVPIVSIVLAVVAALPVFAEYRDALQRFLASHLLLPAISDTLVAYVNQFAAQATRLSLAGSVAFFATAFGALLTIDGTLNRIWASPRPRPLVQRLTIYWTILTVAPLLLAASLAVNGVIVGVWLRSGSLDAIRGAWFTLLPWLTTTAGLTLLYRIVPNAPVRWREALSGGLLAAVLLELLRQGLGLYLAQLPTYTVIYGAFAVVPMLLVWLFLLWMAVLTGALVASGWRAGSHAYDDAAATPAARFADAVAIVRRLACEAPEGPMQSLQAARFRDDFGGDASRAAIAANRLVDAGMIVRLIRLGEAEAPQLWDERWSLASPSEGQCLRPLYERIVGTERSGVALPELDRPLSSSLAPGDRATRAPE